MAQTEGMTPKQKEVYDLAQELGQDAKAIAPRLGTTENNVHNHLRRLRALGHLPERAADTNGGQRAARTTPPPPAPAPAEEDTQPTLLDEIELATGVFLESMREKIVELGERLVKVRAERKEFMARNQAQEAELVEGHERLSMRLAALEKADAKQPS